VDVEPITSSPIQLPRRVASKFCATEKSRRADYQPKNQVGKTLLKLLLYTVFRAISPFLSLCASTSVNQALTEIFGIILCFSFTGIDRNRMDLVDAARWWVASTYIFSLLERFANV